ncbi:MAG: hypothetical protein GY948_23775 [Alphaproteobacteria bacterium]|nr:hypothetical protein [Alphaproteobacteria bacterium]
MIKAVRDDVHVLLLLLPLTWGLSLPLGIILTVEEPKRGVFHMTTPSDPFPFEILPSPAYRPTKGQLFVVFGVLIMVLAALAPAAAMFALDPTFGSGEENFLPYLIGAPVLYVVFLVGARFIARGRRMQAVPAVDMLREDGRAPVLFLRSFDDDDLIDPTPHMVPMGEMFQRRYEETLSSPLSAIGPVISIGRPGNELAMLGGARLFVPDDAWKSAIEFLRKRAATVILMVGRTEGLWWEINSSIETVPLERLLFFFPYVESAKLRQSVWQRFFNFVPARMPLSMKAYRRMEAERQARYALFRKRIQPLLSAPLPENLGNCQFIDFPTNGTPRLLASVRPWWWPIMFLTPSTTKMAINLRRTLAPFVKKLAGS